MLKGIKSKLSKLSRINFILLGVAVIVLAGCAFLAYYGKIPAEEKQVEAEHQRRLAEVRLYELRQIDIEALQQEKEELEEGIAQISFATELQAMGLVSNLVTWASENGVSIVSLATVEGSENLAETEFSTLDYSLQVMGQPSNLSGFLGSIEQGSTATVIDNVSATPEEGWRMSLNVTVYIQPR